MMLGLTLGLLAQGAASGQTWDGGSAATSNWTDGLNWGANVAPVNHGTATPYFAGNTRLTPVLDIGVDMNGVTFDNTAGAFNIITVNGSILTLRAGGVTNNNASVAQAISTGINVGAAQTWGGVGGLTFGGAIAMFGNTLTIDSPATVGLGGAISGAGKIIKNGTGALVLTGSNGAFTGGVTLNSGTLAIGLNAGLGAGPLTINGGTIEGTGGARTLSNAVVVNNDFAVPSGTAVTFAGPVTITGNRTLTNAISNLAISGTIGEDTAGRELTLAGGGTLALSGSGLTLGTSLRHNSGTLTATGLINTLGHTLTQNGGTFTGSLINRGKFVYNGGTHSGNISNEAGGEAVINANLTLTAAMNNVGTLRVANSRTLTFGTQQLTNSGTLELAGGTLSANGATVFTSSGIVSGFGTITTNNTSFSNSGLVSVSGGNLVLASNFSFSNSGTMSVPTGRQLQWNSTAVFGNTGLVQLAGGAFAGTGVLSNNVGGEIRGGGAVLSPLANAGGIVRASGPDPLVITSLSGNNTAGGELRVDEGATMSVQSAFNSSGTIVLGGPSASLNLNSLTNVGTLRGEGRVTGATLNGGVIRAEGGTLTFASTGNTNTAGARLEAGVGTQLLYSQGLATNAGLIALTGGAFDNGNVALANPGRIEGFGTLRTGGLTNTGTITVGGTLDVVGAVTNNGAVNTSSGSAARFFGPVSGPGSFTGTGTVTFLNTFSPGASPATVSFGGDVALAGGSNLVVELGGTTPGNQYDTLAVNGDVTLGGAIDVDLLGGFTPAVGSEFEIVHASGGVAGKFTTASLPSVPNASWQLQYGVESVTLRLALAGDFNFSGTVDAADYTLWRNLSGQGGAALAADANNDGSVNGIDFGVWKAHFGEKLNGGGALAPVPEPSSAVLMMFALLASTGAWRQRAICSRS
jgi:autotransporter-associated beta strand protein